MHLTKRPNSNNWFVELQIDGKRYARSTKTDHKPTAKRIADTIVQKLRIEAIEGPSKKITLEDACKRYMAHRKGIPSESTLKGVNTIILRILDGKLLLSEITGQHFYDLVQHRRLEGCAAQTIKHSVQFLSAVIKQAKREGYTVCDVEPPSVPVKNKRLRYLSLEEEKRLLAELDPNRKAKGIPPQHKRPPHILRELQDNYDIVVMLLDTGARYGEIAKLTWEQIDLDKRTINLWRSKVFNESIIFMTTRVHQILLRRKSSTNNHHVFTNRDGGPRKNSNIAIRRAIRRAGLKDCTIHTFRHTHASRLIQNGLSIYEVRSVLGHTDITTTMRYAHLENVDVTEKARDVIEKFSSKWTDGYSTEIP